MGHVRDGIRPVEPQLASYLEGLRESIVVQAMVVFGSRARNDHWEDSDIDLLVISGDFTGQSRAARTDFLLESWPGIPALEPFGVTPEELCGPGSLLLWDALHQGRPLHDDGIFAEARRLLGQRIQAGQLTPTAGGWQEGPGPGEDGFRII